MTKKKFITISAILLLSVVAISVFIITSLLKNDAAAPSPDLKGKVIGPNPQNIPADQLPLCQPGVAGGISETPQPCFSPEGSVYL